MSPVFCYLIAQGSKLSGIVALLTNGAFLNNFSTPNASQRTRRLMKTTVKSLAHLSDTIVFLFLGIGLVAFNHPWDSMGAGTILFAILNLNVARFLNITIVSFLINRTRTNATKIDAKQQFIMWIAGLRGAMAYALALDTSKQSEAGKIMLLVTLIYSYFTVIGVSSILYPIMMKCDVQSTAEKPLEEN